MIAEIMITNELFLFFWKIAIIPLVIFSVAGIVGYCQEGGKAFGSNIWAPVVWIVTITWIAYWAGVGVFS